MKRFVTVALALSVLGFGPRSRAMEDFAPAKRISGPVPSLPALDVVGWIQDVREVRISADGTVVGMDALERSPMPRDLMTAALTQWRFKPAKEQGRAVASRVLVVGMFRPPALNDGPTLGQPPVTVGSESGETPFPVQAPPPRYPLLAVADGVVLVEAAVDSNGRVRRAEVVASTPGFDQSALAAAQSWVFRPARRSGRNIEAFVYLVFGFRRPVT